MGLDSTPSANRLHIGFFGSRNAGKSSLLNAVTGQEIALVSDIAGTTTDPVSKTMELLPLGPVVLTDTAGIDDEGVLGGMRVKKTRQVLNKTDIAVLVVSSQTGLSQYDRELISQFEAKNIPYLTAYSKADITMPAELPDNAIAVSAKSGLNIHELKERIGALVKSSSEKPLIADKLTAGDTAVLVVPIDASAPKGRLILPQQQTIRELIEAGVMCAVCRDTELPLTLASLSRKPAVVITDSQAFGRVAKATPQDVPLTSFSIIMARRKGFLEQAVQGAAMLDKLRDGDKVLISEGCSHHRQCEDIGTVKIPAWLKKYTGKELQLTFTSGSQFPEELSEYALIIHCGGCMLTEREMSYRMKCAADAGVPVTNYGTAIAMMNGILRRSLDIFPDIAALLDE